MSESPISEPQRIALEILANGPMTPMELGKAIWGGQQTRRSWRHAKYPQSFARPAGCILWHLEKRRLVQRMPDGKRFELVRQVESLPFTEKSPDERLADH